MHNPLIAITVSMVTAAIFSVLTEPAVKSHLPGSAITKIKPAGKEERLYPFGIHNCLFARERLSESNSCLIEPANHERRLSEGRTVIVHLLASEILHPRTSEPNTRNS